MQSQVNATHDVNTRAGAGASARCGEAGRELDTVDLPEPPPTQWCHRCACLPVVGEGEVGA